MTTIDLNADVGEGMPDEELLPYLTSANVACGFHAGDPSTMDRTVAAALARGIRVGAHPGFADRENFGRATVEMPAGQIENLVLYQIGALDAFVRSRAGTLSHVKPHGGLYHMAGKFPDVARAVAEAVRRYHPALILVGAVGSMLLEAGREAGLSVAGEAFADRRYLPDGNLVPRSRPDALVTDPDMAAAQAVSLVCEGYAVATDGTRLHLQPDTICLHGDTPGAPAIARRVGERLRDCGVRVAAMEALPPGAHAAASLEARP